MKPAALHSFLLWRSSVEPQPSSLARDRFTAAVSLLPAVMTGLFLFGWRGGLVLLVSLGSAFLTDYCTGKIVNKTRMLYRNPQGLEDGLWLITGLLLALLLPPHVPLWIPALGACAGILLGKHFLQVDGAGIIQPAALGLLLLHLVCMPYLHPGQNNWPVFSRPLQLQGRENEGLVARGLHDFFVGDIRNAIPRQDYHDQLFEGKNPVLKNGSPAQAVLGARPLDTAKLEKDSRTITSGYTATTWDVLHGYTPGPLGGTCGLALIFGVLLLVFSGAVSWLTPLFALLTLAAGTYIFDPAHVGIHLLTGYTLMGFFYLAADPATTARSRRGRILAGISAGVLELLLRQFTPLSEGTFITAFAVQALCIWFDARIAPPKETPVGTGSPTGFNWSSLGRL